MATSTYTVAGMTCDHCAASVREEVAGVGGIEGVDVDLQTGRLVVTGEGFAEDAVKRAVEDAGYALVS